MNVTVRVVPVATDDKTVSVRGASFATCSRHDDAEDRQPGKSAEGESPRRKTPAPQVSEPRHVDVPSSVFGGAVSGSYRTRRIPRIMLVAAVAR